MKLNDILEAIKALRAVAESDLGDHEDMHARYKKIADYADNISCIARKASQKEFDFGSVIWAKPKVLAWVNNILRYRSVKFFGFLRGRIFIGVLIGSDLGGNLTHKLKLERVTHDKN